MFLFLSTRAQPSKKRIIFLVAMSLLLISGALLFNRPEQTQVIHVSFPNGAVLEAEVADTPEKLLFGLAFQDSLPPDKGMLYIFDKSASHRVWTKEFRIPVDIIWIDESKKIVHIVEEALNLVLKTLVPGMVHPLAMHDMSLKRMQDLPNVRR